MNLTEKNIDNFIDALASKEAVPGGGSVAALSGALGVSLTMMVANLTIGREKYKEHEDLMNEILVSGEKLKNKFSELVNKDVDAYNKVMMSYKLPKETDEEKNVRTAEIQKALKIATQVPFEMMETAFDAIMLTQKALGKSNINAISDLGVAALNLKTTTQGAWLNVLINLGSIKDLEFVIEYQTRGEVLLKDTISLSTEIYNTVSESFKRI